MNSLKITLFLSLAGLLLTGCPKKGGPIPQDTLIGKSSNLNRTDYDTLPNRANGYADGSYGYGSNGADFSNSTYTDDGNIYPSTSTDFSSSDFNSSNSGSGFDGSDINGGLVSRNDTQWGANDALGANANVYQSIYFGFDEYTVNENERSKLVDAFDYLRNNPQASFIAAGHTDWRGTNEYNTGLGDRRASNVRSFLVGLGIEQGRIQILSKGELESTEGVEKNDPQAKQDRRVDLVIIQ